MCVLLADDRLYVKMLLLLYSQQLKPWKLLFKALDWPGRSSSGGQRSIICPMSGACTQQAAGFNQLSTSDNRLLLTYILKIPVFSNFLNLFLYFLHVVFITCSNIILPLSRFLTGES